MTQIKVSDEQNNLVKNEEHVLSESNMFDEDHPIDIDNQKIDVEIGGKDKQSEFNNTFDDREDLSQSNATNIYNQYLN